MPIFRTEKDFERQFCDYIIENKINPINMREVLGFVSQPNLGGYGIADIITLEKHGSENVINVIEMKNTQFQAGMIFQIGRYMEAVKLAGDHRVLSEDIFKINLTEPKELLFEGVRVIGSIVCPESQDVEVTPGVCSVFNQLGVTLYSADLECLSVYFTQMNSAGDFDVEQIDKIQSSLKQLNYPVDLF